MPHSDDVNNVFNYFDTILFNLDKSFDDDIAPPPAHKILENNLKILQKNLKDFMKKIKIFKL